MSSRARWRSSRSRDGAPSSCSEARSRWRPCRRSAHARRRVQYNSALRRAAHPVHPAAGARTTAASRSGETTARPAARATAAARPGATATRRTTSAARRSRPPSAATRTRIRAVRRESTTRRPASARSRVVSVAVALVRSARRDGAPARRHGNAARCAAGRTRPASSLSRAPFRRALARASSGHPLAARSHGCSRRTSAVRRGASLRGPGRTTPEDAARPPTPTAVRSAAERATSASTVAARTGK